MAIRKSGGGQVFRRQIRRKFPDKSQAMKYRDLVETALADAERKYRENIAPCCSIGNRLDEFLRDSRAGIGRGPCSARTLRTHRRRLEAFDVAFQRKPLASITRDRLERWMDRRLGDVEPDTVNADLISLHAFARWAQRKGYAPDILPLFTVPKLRVPGKLAGKNRKPPKAKEFGGMVKIIQRIREVRSDIYLFLLGMALFGLRPAAVARLRRQDARPPRAGDGGRLYVKGLKGGPDRDLPIPAGDLREIWMRECLRMGRELDRTGPWAPLVPCRSGKSVRNPGGWTSASLNNALKRLCRRLKIRLDPYEIRHTCMTWLLRRADIAQANSQHYAGHTVITTQNAYNSLLGKEAEPAYAVVAEELGRLL